MSILIKSVRILGGAGGAGTTSADLRDVYVSGGKISAIGNFPGKSAEKIVDGKGAYLSPGFIDVNTDSDHYLSIFSHPPQEDFIRQGVTTIVGGMCGASLAPLLYGSLESIRKWADISDVNVDWHTVREFLETLDKKPLALNFATLVGHATVRRALIGERIRDLTKNELHVFGETLLSALKEGAFGLSTGLGYAHSRRTPSSEIKFLDEIVRGQNGVYATHLRNNAGELGKSIEETVKLATDLGVRTVISHFMPIVGNEKEYEDALRKIESLPEATQLKFDVYPSGTSILAIYTFLPVWAQNGGMETMLANIKDAWLRARIIKEIPKLDLKEFVIAQAPGNEFFVGKSLKEIAEFYDASNYSAALLLFMEATGMKATVFYKNLSEPLIKKAIRSSRSLIASNSASFRDAGKMLKPERAISTFTKFLGMAEGEKLMPLHDAIRKITAEPARMFDFAGRGEIQEGNIADLALFSITDGNTPKVKNVEVRSVVVHGELVLQDGIYTGKFPGKNLRHRAPLQ